MVEWLSADAPVPYPDALSYMQARARAIAAGTAAEQIWLLEHPPLYTAGTSARPHDLIQADRLPVFAAGRGGQYTYHGPGQRIAYVMLNVGARGRDVRGFVNNLESWVIQTLAKLGVTGERRTGRVGVWVVRRDLAPMANGALREQKIAAIGVRLTKWVSMHGISINVAPDLSHYDGIVACGIDQHGITSLADLGLNTGMAQIDAALKKSFDEVFQKG